MTKGAIALVLFLVMLYGFSLKNLYGLLLGLLAALGWVLALLEIKGETDAPRPENRRRYSDWSSGEDDVGDSGLEEWP